MPILVAGLQEQASAGGRPVQEDRRGGHPGSHGDDLVVAGVTAVLFSFQCDDRPVLALGLVYRHVGYVLLPQPAEAENYMAASQVVLHLVKIGATPALDIHT